MSVTIDSVNSSKRKLSLAECKEQINLAVEAVENRVKLKREKIRQADEKQTDEKQNKADEKITKSTPLEEAIHSKQTNTNETSETNKTSKTNENLGTAQLNALATQVDNDIKHKEEKYDTSHHIDTQITKSKMQSYSSTAYLEQSANILPRDISLFTNDILSELIYKLNIRKGIEDKNSKECLRECCISFKVLSLDDYNTGLSRLKTLQLGDIIDNEFYFIENGNNIMIISYKQIGLQKYSISNLKLRKLIMNNTAIVYRDTKDKLDNISENIVFKCEIDELDIQNVYFAHDKTKNFISNCKIGKVDISNSSLHRVKYFTKLLNECEVGEINIGNISLEKTVRAYEMFNNSTFNSEVDISGIKLNSSIEISKPFNFKCKTIKGLNTLNQVNVSKGGEISNLFEDCELDSLDFSEYQGNEALYYVNMFLNLKIREEDGLSSISNLEIDKHNELDYMFSSSRIDELKLDNWDTTNIKRMYRMFYKAKIKRLSLNSLVITGISSEMFSEAHIEELSITNAKIRILPSNNLGAIFSKLKADVLDLSNTEIIIDKQTNLNNIFNESEIETLIINRKVVKDILKQKVLVKIPRINGVKHIKIVK